MDRQNPEKMNQAAFAVYKYRVDAFEGQKGAHLGTIISAAGRLAGTSLFRSFAFPGSEGMKPGTVVLSEQANVEGGRLMGLLLAFVTHNGVVIEPDKLVVKPPEGHTPRLTLSEVQVKFQDGYFKILADHGLGYLHGAQAGAFACGLLILETKTVVDPHITCGMAGYGFVEGAKTVPEPLKG
jgi:hypothetical protein